VAIIVVQVFVAKLRVVLLTEADLGVTAQESGGDQTVFVDPIELIAGICSPEDIVRVSLLNARTT